MPRAAQLSAPALVIMVGCTAIFGGCNAIFGLDDYGPGSSTSSVGGTPNGGGGGMGGDASTTTVGGSGGTAATGGAGGTGGEGGSPPPVLSDRGIVARYFIDEASIGQTPPRVLDAMSPEFDLDITYDVDLAYGEGMTGRGLTWNGVNPNGRAANVIDGSKIATSLTGTTVTIEVVFDALSGIVGSGALFRLAHPSDPGARLNLVIRDEMYPSMDFNDDAPGSDAQAIWDVDVVSIPRAVVHVVVDTAESDVASRMKLFVDGVQAPPLLNPPTLIIPPSENEPLVLCAGCVLSVGNSASGNRGFTGSISYFALYNAALTSAEITNNLAILTDNDDAPPPAR